MHSHVCSKRLAALCVVAILVTATDLHADSEYAFEVVSQRLPAEVREDQRLSVPLVLRNRGSSTWDPDRGFNVSYHWRSQDGTLLVRDGERTRLPHAVPPGETVSVMARVQVPIGTGVRLLEWDVVHESVTWFSERANQPLPGVAIAVLPARISHAFSILDSESVWLMPTGSVRNVRLQIRNDGIEAWEAGREINVAYHWRHDDARRAIADGTRTPLPRAVAPGESISLPVRVDAPPNAGVYALQWDMVEENVTWFSERDLTDEPPRRVFVPAVPPASVASLAALLCLAFALIVTRRGAPDSPLRGPAAVVDVAWLGMALFFKQLAFLGLMTDAPSGESRWLAALPVVAITLVVTLLPRRLRPWAALAINAALSLLFLANLIHLRFFGNVISIASASSARQIGDVLASAASLWRREDIWFLLDLIPGIAIAFVVLRLATSVGPLPARRFALLLLVLLVPGVLAAWRVAHDQKGVTVQVFHRTFLARDIGLLNYHVRDLWSHLRSRVLPRELPADRRLAIERWFRKTAPRRAGSGSWFGAAPGRNLLMLQVESLQSFVVSLEVDGQEVMPNLNRLRRGGASAFFDCADQTAQGRTSDSELASQVSLLPLPEGAAAFRYPSNDYLALGEILGGRGYTTMSAVPFDGAFWNRRVSHRQYGFRTRHFGKSFAEGTVVGWGLNDRDFLKQMGPRLDALREPFAALLITLSNHHPYESFPDSLKRLELGPHEGTSLGNYLHAMHHFDTALGEFLVALATRGLADDTVIAVWGDHDSGLGRDAELAAFAGRQVTDAEYALSRSIPLAVIVPGVPQLSALPVQCGHVDLAPTLLALLGVDPARLPFVGRNLFGSPGDSPLVQRHGAWRTSTRLFLPKGTEREDGHCFDVGTLRRLPPAECESGYLAARDEMGISRDVIEYDLQVPLARALARGGIETTRFQ